MSTLLYSGIVIFGVLLICFVIFILSTVAWYFYRQRILSDPTLSGRENPSLAKCFSYRKLKPDVITFNYKRELSEDSNQGEAADLSDEKNCVVCLRGLQDDEFVRQLPKCKHTFHAPCIDMWLYSHTKCPVCRTAVELLPSTTSQDEEGGALTTSRRSMEVSVDISPALTSSAISNMHPG